MILFKILSPGRSSESRLSPPVTPIMSTNHSFETLSASATSITPDAKRSIVKESSLRASLEEDHENKTDLSGIQRQVKCWKNSPERIINCFFF